MRERVTSSTFGCEKTRIIAWRSLMLGGGPALGDRVSAGVGEGGLPGGNKKSRRVEGRGPSLLMQGGCGSGCTWMGEGGSVCTRTK